MGSGRRSGLESIEHSQLEEKVSELQGYDLRDVIDEIPGQPKHFSS